MKSPSIDKVVSYYEGGSLACKKETYWRVGGHNEDFWGYGCEDCEFYERLSKNTKWYGNRTHDLIHLHHGRDDGWTEHHITNKTIYSSLQQLDMNQRILKQQHQMRLIGYTT
jgi:predicted glycosyltransferase involved in capsule biosynthesis